MTAFIDRQGVHAAAHPTSVTMLGDVTTPSFDEYYRADHQRVLGLAIVLTGSRQVAEDLCHDALTEAHGRWEKVRHYDDPGAWVRRVMVNKARSRFRRLRTERRALTVVGARREPPAESQRESDEVWTALRQLPRRQAEALALFYWEDRSLAQIADILGCGTETVKTHLKRGRTTLAQTLTPPTEDDV